MSSNINSVANRIDAAYPVAGQDNSSQGFRDNFASIKLAFSTATTEISALQLNAAQVTQANDFQFNGSLVRAKIQNSGFVANNTGATTGDLNYALANYYKVVTISSATTYSVSNWPVDGIYAQLRLEITAPASSKHTINFDAVTGTILSDTSNVTLPDTINTGTTHVYDLWTTNNGATVFVNKVGGPYA
jgi:hypothetical protein